MEVTEGSDGKLTYNFENEENLAGVLKDLKVLGRSTPYDKYMLVCAMQSRGAIVAVTGESHNDADALATADVGFAMGLAGCETAKDAAPMMLIDDNFASIIRAVMWGRSIYSNVRKFLLFQMTVNLAVLFFVVIGCVTFGEPPFSVPQLIWVNMIMDVLAALALATEPPNPKIIRDKPTKVEDDIFTGVLWR